MHKLLFNNLRRDYPDIPDLYFSKVYWKNIDNITDFEPSLPKNFSVKRKLDTAGFFIVSKSVHNIADAFGKKDYQSDVSALHRVWNNTKYLKTDGFHELHIDTERAKILAQTKCNFDVNDFKAPYKTMVVVYPDDLEKEFIDSNTTRCPVLTICHHDTEEGYLEANHLYVEKTKNGQDAIFDNYFAFGCKMPDYHLSIEESLSNIKRLRDVDGHNNHAYYYTRIALNALMVSTMKDWSEPLGKKYESDSRKDRQKVKGLLPNYGAGLSFTAHKVTMKLPTLTIPSGSGMTGTGSRQRWHTREAHWRRVHLGPDKRVEWRWIDSYEVNRDLKPLDAIISTHHRLNHDVKGV